MASVQRLLLAILVNAAVTAAVTAAAAAATANTVNGHYEFYATMPNVHPPQVCLSCTVNGCCLHVIVSCTGQLTPVHRLSNAHAAEPVHL